MLIQLPMSSKVSCYTTCEKKKDWYIDTEVCADRSLWRGSLRMFVGSYRMCAMHSSLWLLLKTIKWL